jgi:hypothetical protein
VVPYIVEAAAVVEIAVGIEVALVRLAEAVADRHSDLQVGLGADNLGDLVPVVADIVEDSCRCKALA